MIPSSDDYFFNVNKLFVDMADDNNTNTNTNTNTDAAALYFPLSSRSC
jgi:hypothetical protein